jgi:hypothetical protein
VPNKARYVQTRALSAERVARAAGQIALSQQFPWAPARGGQRVFSRRRAARARAAARRGLVDDKSRGVSVSVRGRTLFDDIGLRLYS